ncbi:centrosome cycle, partial [Homalodisca vitripennis]
MFLSGSEVNNVRNSSSSEASESEADDTDLDPTFIPIASTSTSCRWNLAKNRSINRSVISSSEDEDQIAPAQATTKPPLRGRARRPAHVSSSESDSDNDNPVSRLDFTIALVEGLAAEWLGDQAPVQVQRAEQSIIGYKNVKTGLVVLASTVDSGASVMGRAAALGVGVQRISLLHPLSVDMKPVADERLKYQGMMVLRNNGRSVVPVKLSLVQLSHLEVDMFFLDREKTTSVTYRLEPGQTLKQVINCLTPPIFECSRTTGQTLVNAQVQVTLATSAQVQLPPITATTFTARLSPNFFCVPASLTMTADSPLPCQVYNSGTQVYSFQATATSGFTVQPCIFTAQPQQTVTLMITFLGRTFKKGILTLNASELQSKSSGKFYTIQLQGTGSCSTSSSVSGTPQNSRPTSPISPCNSIAEGGLQLACTHKQLVWGGCHLQQRVVKSCSLKNLNSQREKLRLSLSDPHNCFKILTEKKTVECEMLVSLQPMENCQVSVVMLAANPGPKWGHLTISRFNQPQDKKVLLLYRFGGKTHVNIEGVMTDPEQHMWLYLDPAVWFGGKTYVNIEGVMTDPEQHMWLYLDPALLLYGFGGKTHVNIEGVMTDPEQHIVTNCHLHLLQLLLYGFGGKAHVNIEGVMTDPEQHMWLYLDPDTLCSTFVLTNTGDYTAFFKISE